MGWFVKLTENGMKKLSAIWSMNEARVARRQGENVLAADRSTAKAIESGAFDGQPIMRHSGHDLPDGAVGSPHYQSADRYGHTFWGMVGAAGAGLVGSLLDPFDAVAGECG